MFMTTKSLFGNYEGAVFGEKAGWRGATKEALRAATTEQLRRHSRAGRSQTAFSPKTLRAAGLLSVAGVDSFLTARCGRCARPKPPWPQPKSLAAAPLVVSKQALRVCLACLPLVGYWFYPSKNRHNDDDSRPAIKRQGNPKVAS